MRYHVILNPASGGGAGRKLRGEIERELNARGIDFVLTETERPGHAVELAQAAARTGADAVVGAGGDGTMHEVANGLLTLADDPGASRPAAAEATPDPVPALGVIPVGTGNDFAKLLVGGMDRRRSYDALAEGRIAVFDVGRISWDGGAEYLVNSIGTGVDVEVLRQVKRLPSMPGVLGYLVGLLRAVIGFKALPLHIRLDGRALDRDIMIVAVQNGPCLGGGFWVCPGALPDDGRLDICMVGDLNYFQIARTIPRVMRGTHEHLAVVTMDRAKTIELEAPGAAPLFFQLDGELREPADVHRLRIELVPGALRVVGAPAPAAAAARTGGSAAAAPSAEGGV